MAVASARAEILLSAKRALAGTDAKVREQTKRALSNTKLGLDAANVRQFNRSLEAISKTRSSSAFQAHGLDMPE